MTTIFVNAITMTRSIHRDRHEIRYVSSGDPYVSSRDPLRVG